MSDSTTPGSGSGDFRVNYDPPGLPGSGELRINQPIPPCSKPHAGPDPACDCWQPSDPRDKQIMGLAREVGRLQVRLQAERDRIEKLPYPANRALSLMKANEELEAEVKRIRAVVEDQRIRLDDRQQRLDQAKLRAFQDQVTIQDLREQLEVTEDQVDDWIAAYNRTRDDLHEALREVGQAKRERDAAECQMCIPCSEHGDWQ